MHFCALMFLLLTMGGRIKYRGVAEDLFASRVVDVVGPDVLSSLTQLVMKKKVNRNIPLYKSRNVLVTMCVSCTYLVIEKQLTHRSNSDSLLTQAQATDGFVAVEYERQGASTINRLFNLVRLCSISLLSTVAALPVYSLLCLPDQAVICRGKIILRFANDDLVQKARGRTDHSNELIE